MPAPQRPPALPMIGTGMLIVIVTLVFARLAFGLILPPMRDDLGLSYQQVGNLGTMSALGYLALVMTAGVTAARWGGRRTVLLGVILVTLGCIGLSVATHYWLLLALMTLLGIGTAFSYTPLVSLLASWYPERRGAVIGALNAGVGVGMLVAGALIPFMTETFVPHGWRLSWAVFAACGVIAGAALLAFIHNPPPPPGAVDGQPLPPVNKGAVYRNRRVITVGLLYGIVGITYIVHTIFMFSFALDAGLSPLTAGRLTALMGVLSIFAGPLWGGLSDRTGRGNTLLLSTTLTLLGTLLPVLWPTLTGFVVHYLVLGVTVSGMFTSVLAAATDQVQPREAPLAVSYVTLFYAIGQLVGPGAAGLLIDWSGSFRVTFAISCVVMLAGVYLSWQVRSFRRPAAAPAVERGVGA